VACPTGSGGSGQNAALTAERVSASLWRISPLAVSDEGCDESDLVRVGNAAAFAAAGERSRTPPDIIPKPSAQRSACSPLARAGARVLSGCARRGWHIVVEYADNGVSGAKGRENFDALLKAATKRKIDVVAAWSVDRLGRSLQHLVSFLTGSNAIEIHHIITNENAATNQQMLSVATDINTEALFLYSSTLSFIVAKALCRCFR